MISATIFVSKEMHYFRVVFNGAVKPSDMVVVHLDSDSDRNAFDKWNETLQFIDFKSFTEIVKQNLANFYIRQENRHPKWFDCDWIIAAGMADNNSEVWCR